MIYAYSALVTGENQKFKPKFQLFDPGAAPHRRRPFQTDVATVIGWCALRTPK